MEQLKAILVDDELISLENLQHKLTTFCPDIKVVASTQKPEEVKQLIYRYHPDVLFLDVEMPRLNGFSLLEELDMEQVNCDIIFTTAYDHYAIEAIRISAFDYLVKPIAIKDLQNAVDRSLKKHAHHTTEKLEVLKNNLSSDKSQEDKIGVSTTEGIEFIQIKNIQRIESSSNYSKIFFTDGKKLLVSKLLREFEELLVPYQFYRVHNSHLINLNFVKKYLRGDGGQVVMENGDIIDVARRKKDEFLQLLSSNL